MLNLDGFGRTLLLALFLFLIFAAFRMVIRVADPYTRKVSESLADTLLTAA